LITTPSQILSNKKGDNSVKSSGFTVIHSIFVLEIVHSFNPSNFTSIGIPIQVDSALLINQ
jgi:hypothetical protein